MAAWAEQDDIGQEADFLLAWLDDPSLSKAFKARSGASKVSVAAQLITVLERGLDYLHSVCRRRHSEAVYEDLMHGRVSHARSALIMRQLTASQKGGWLTARVLRR